MLLQVLHHVLYCSKQKLMMSMIQIHLNTKMVYFKLMQLLINVDCFSATHRPQTWPFNPFYESSFPWGPQKWWPEARERKNKEHNHWLSRVFELLQGTINQSYTCTGTCNNISQRISKPTNYNNVHVNGATPYHFTKCDESN